MRMYYINVLFAHITRGKIPWEARAFSDSGPSSATSEVQNEHHKSDDEQDMDEPAGDVECESAAPKQQQKNGDN